MSRGNCVIFGLGAALLGTSVFAQDRDAAAQHLPENEDDTIIVTAGKPEGAVLGDIQPELTLSPRDIRSYGVSSISELIAELAPQTSSGQGRGESPVVLLNGKRVSSFNEIRDIPTEAIQRTEILPEEVALKYGYRPNQKVVNIVLRKRFRAYVGEAKLAAPTEGGQMTPGAEASYLRIGDFGRFNVSAKYEQSSILLESERNVMQQPLPVPSAFSNGTATSNDIGKYRSLLPQTETATVNAALARTIFKDVAASFNGTLTYNQSNDRLGFARARIALPAASPYSPSASDIILNRYLDELGPLAQRNRDLTAHAGMTLNGSRQKWQWSLTASADHGVSRTLSDRGYDLSGFQAQITALDPLADPYAPLNPRDISGVLQDRACTVSNVFTMDLLISGPLFELPAGAVTSSFKMGGSSSDLDAVSLRSGIATAADLSRDQISGQASLDIPLTSVRNNVLAAIGDLSVNFNAAYDRLSDLNGLRAYGGGLNWTPVKPVKLIVSYNKDQGAPTVQQLGNPNVITSGVRVFDYVRGETVDVARLSGGNPFLKADDRSVFKAGLTLKPFAKENLTLTADYTNNRVRNPVATFPTGTAAIEAAFPSRFVRDADERLISIDSRPVNFARQDQEEVRWGINFSKQLWTPPRPAGASGSGGPGGQDVNVRDLLPSGATSEAGRNAPTASGASTTSDAAGASPTPGAAGGAGGPGGGPGGGFGRGGGGRGTRLQLALYHTIHLKEQVLVYQGGPVLDLLDGDAIGAAGGQPRHEIQAQAGLTHNGLGARLSASWQSATDVTGGANGDLHFSDLATLNLRLFANLGQQQALVSKWGFFRGTRLTFSVANLFNSHLTVRDGTGATPIRYQPAYLDPLGRSVRISFRKSFF